MSDNVGFDALLNVYLDILKETVAEHSGYYLEPNNSMLETLSRVSAEVASRPVSERCATLAAQVNHTALYLEMVNDSMRGVERPNDDWTEIWRSVSVVTPEEWTAAQTRLRTAYDSFRATVANPDEWHSMAAFGDALAALAHTAYHLGEVRQALCTLQSFS